MDLSKNHPKFEKLTLKLGYQFVRSELLAQAFMHSSYVNEQARPDLQDNERLEFLGDAVLDLATSHILMEYFLDAPEGDLSKYRAMLVDESGLFQVAQHLELGKYLFLGKGEEQCQGREKPSILANTMEALLGALYLDAGFDTALEIIRTLFAPFLEKIGTRGELPYDFKSQLQEYTQKEYKTLPAYRLSSESGPAHDKTFSVELLLNGNVLAVEEGKSKKEAEQKAAREAYYCLIGSTDH
jgi:ribonuclease III